MEEKILSQFEYTAKLVRVIDGDTVDVDIDLGFGIWIRKERVRLSHIDTPEIRTKDNVEKLFGLIAKQRVENFFDSKNKLTLISKSFKSGKYGRVLGDFKIDGEIRSLCSILISEGHAVPYNGQSRESIEQEHKGNRERLLLEGVVTQEQIDKVSS